MLELLRLLLALLASLGTPSPAPDAVQPITIEPAGPPRFCEPTKGSCK